VRPLLVLAASLALAGCGSSASGDFEAGIVAAATEAGLDIPTWQACRGTAAPAARVAEDLALGSAAGVSGTPTFLVNGTPVVGAVPLPVLSAAVSVALTSAVGSGLPQASYYATAFPDLPVLDSPVRGPGDAWVTVVEFGDFECPYCGEEEPVVEELLAEGGSQVRLVWKNFPLAAIHPHAEDAAVAAECALDQGKFWEMHDAIYANQGAIFGGDD